MSLTFFSKTFARTVGVNVEAGLLEHVEFDLELDNVAVVLRGNDPKNSRTNLSHKHKNK